MSCNDSVLRRVDQGGLITRLYDNHYVKQTAVHPPMPLQAHGSESTGANKLQMAARQLPWTVKRHPVHACEMSLRRETALLRSGPTILVSLDVLKDCGSSCDDLQLSTLTLLYIRSAAP